MNNIYKYIILYTVAVLFLLGLFYTVDNWYDENIKIQRQVLIKQAQTHFNAQINTREWNSEYGGVYVKPKKNQIPNPYLVDNALKVNEKLTLIKINPAWMTRQLSELSQIKDFSFNLTSLTPINPNNKASEFEKRALEKFEKTQIKEYYEFDDKNKFQYMGALVTNESCLVCHKLQGYELGDIRGGISVTLSSSEYNDIVDSLSSKVNITKISLFLFISIITLLIHKQFSNNLSLVKEVKSRTKEIETTKKLLQKILDADKNFLLVSDGTEIIFANQTVLDFAGFTSLSDFENRDKHISDKFVNVTDADFLKSHYEGMHWIEYLQREQHNMHLKVLIKKESEDRYFKPSSKEVKIDNRTLYLITFDDITDEYLKIKNLTTEASTDALTGLFNRRKLDDVLSKEIEIAREISSPLSLIFLDIDHFKNVNDTFGHDTGDTVLIKLAEIITSTIRKGDFVARWGGEEFMIALQGTDGTEASNLAEILRVAVETSVFDIAGRIKISLGVTEYRANESKDSFTKRGDEALYEAKSTGRNRVVVK